MAPRKSAGTAFILVSSLLLTACFSGFVSSVGELVTLRAAIIKEFGDEGVSVNLNNGETLVVTFVNSPLNHKGSQAREQRAQESALLVKKHYSAINKIQEIWITFVKHETRYLVINYTGGLEAFAFDRNAHAIKRREHDSDFNNQYGEHLELAAVYSPSQQQTEISIRGLQLTGNMIDGLSLIPHYSVPGDATQTKSKTQPGFVAFDFASFSREDRFPGQTSISVLIDENVAFKAKGKFQGARSADGTYSKYLYLKLSYPQFRKLTQGQSITIVLGDESHKLSQEQWDALRALREYVEEE
jgi:hypothetical protein